MCSDATKQSKRERKPMSEELKRAYSHWSALDLELAETQALIAELQRHAELLKNRVNEADRERMRLAKLVGYL